MPPPRGSAAILSNRARRAGSESASSTSGRLCADVIEEIEGATSEPGRRRHTAALSAVIAWVALAMLVMVVVGPGPFGAPPLRASPAPSESGELMFYGSSPIAQLRVDPSVASECADGTKLTSPILVAVEMDSGRVFAPNADGRTGRSVPGVLVPAQTSWLTVICATPETWRPWRITAR